MSARPTRWASCARSAGRFSPTPTMPAPFLDRVAAFCGGAIRVRPTGEHEDPDGMAIEPFELHDNLMLAGGVIASGGCLVTEAVPAAERYTDLAAFTRCVARTARALGRDAQHRNYGIEAGAEHTL